VPNLSQLDSVTVLALGKTGISVEALKPLAALSNLKSINAEFDDADEWKKFDEEMGEKAWLHVGLGIEWRVVQYGLVRRVTMISATKVAWKEFEHDVAEFIHGLAMPP
jgi:hypothetical protein